MGSFFIKIGDGIIKFCLYFIEVFNSLENTLKNKKNVNGNRDAKDSITQGSIAQNSINQNNNHNPSKDKSKFDLNKIKSLFFNEEFKEELIFESLENKSSKSKFNSNSKSKGFLSFFTNNKTKKSTLTNKTINDLNDLNNPNNLNKQNNLNNLNKLHSFSDRFDNKTNNDNQSSFNILINKLLFNFKAISKFGLYFIVFLVVIIFLLGFFIAWEISLTILIGIILVFLTILYMPKMKIQNNSVSFSRELPYALRQLATELRSGKSLFNALESVVQADYGVLSFEFSRVLEEIKYGESTENAFMELEDRINSEALSRVIREILSTLRVGGNLAKSLSIIAEDINFEMRMKLKDYAQRLNAFIMIYTFIAILAPVVFLTLLLAASTVMGDIVPGDLLLILYGVFFPMLIIFLGVMIKKLEPKI